jgi:SAM-dependent methyltransferase
MLEIGAGQGGIGARLARRFRYVGVEPDPISASIARTRIERSGGRFLQGTASDLPRNRYDVVCAFEVLEHIEDDRAALGEWTTFLKPGGLLVLTVPAYSSRFAAADRNVGHYRRYDPDDLRSKLEGVGLRGIKIRTTGFPLGYALENVRNLLAWINPERGDTKDRTLASGRLYQPSAMLGVANAVVTLPFRWAQRPFSRTRLGTGLVAHGVFHSQDS